MPEISRFFGIVIAMFYDEHNPPHFHVRYNEHKAEIGIQTLSLLAGAPASPCHGAGDGMGDHPSGRVDGGLVAGSAAS
jgi:hypothetical protein